MRQILLLSTLQFIIFPYLISSVQAETTIKSPTVDPIIPIKIPQPSIPPAAVPVASPAAVPAAVPVASPATTTSVTESKADLNLKKDKSLIKLKESETEWSSVPTAVRIYNEEFKQRGWSKRARREADWNQFHFPNGISDSTNLNLTLNKVKTSKE